MVDFEQRLAETIAWCTAGAIAADPKGSLRSKVTRPPMLSRVHEDAVQIVASKRRRQMPSPSEAHGGRLLAYFPDADLADGAAEVASKGFFDLHNVPPWDTWIAPGTEPTGGPSYQDYVVCWVPPVFVEVARRGLAVHVGGCIAWLEDTQIRVRKELLRFVRP